MKKIIVCVLSFIMICSCFISCSKTEGNDGAVNYEVQLEAPPEQTGKLVIYQAPEMEDILQLAVPIFKAKFPEVEVELKEFGSYAEDLKNGSQNSENYRTQLQSELMAGQGPDILLWNNRPESGLYGSGFADVNKVLESGVFYNLDNFIVHDDTFDINDYNENVLNGGMYKGERLFIPITYGVTAFTTSKENLDRNQIKLSEDLNFNQFSKIISDYCKNNEDNINN